MGGKGREVKGWSLGRVPGDHVHLMILSISVNTVQYQECINAARSPSLPEHNLIPTENLPDDLLNRV